jgi:hypothetical protein
MKLKLLFTLVVLASLLAAMISLVREWPTHAASASTGTLNGTNVTINNGPGDQTDPHVSGNWVTYTDDSTGLDVIHYYNLTTGQDAVIDNNAGADDLSGISGTTVVYTHEDASGSLNINAYVIGSGNPPVTLDPSSSQVIRTDPAIGNRTVVWVDFTSTPSTPQIMVYNLDTQTDTNLSNDTTTANIEPAVNPDGSVVVWAKCNPAGYPCQVWAGIQGNGGTWNLSQLTSSNFDSQVPHTDGKIVTYQSLRTINGTTTQNIYWQPVGGTEQAVPFPVGSWIRRNAHTSGNLICFQGQDVGSSNADIYVYSLDTQTLYQVTNTPNLNEMLDDISVTPDGVARVVWAVQESDFNVYGFIFQAPSADAPLTITHMVVGANNKGLAGLGATFTDADPNGKLTQYTATITWGDGGTSQGVIAKNPFGAGFVVGSAHQYAKAGTYSVTLTINDSGGSSVTETKTLVVPPDRH